MPQAQRTTVAALTAIPWEISFIFLCSKKTA